MSIPKNTDSVPVAELQSHFDEEERWKAIRMAIVMKRDHPAFFKPVYVDPWVPGAAP